MNTFGWLISRLDVTKEFVNVNMGSAENAHEQKCKEKKEEYEYNNNSNKLPNIIEHPRTVEYY